jgi:hypothetical protein
MALYMHKTSAKELAKPSNTSSLDAFINAKNDSICEETRISFKHTTSHVIMKSSRTERENGYIWSR